MSSSEVQAIKDGLDELKGQFTEFSTSLNEIKIFIAGNQKLDSKDRGMNGRLEKLETAQEKALKYYWMFIGGAFVVGFVLPYLWQFFMSKK